MNILLWLTQLLTRLLRFLFWWGLILVTVPAVMPIPPALEGVAAHDRMANAIAFGVLTLVGSLAYRGDPQRPARLGAGLACWGITLECAQLLLPDRTFSGLDIVANIIGVVAAALVARAVLFLGGAR